MNETSLMMAARQLLKSRLRRHTFAAKLTEGGANERVWWSMLTLEEAIQSEAQASWVAECEANKPDDDTLVRVVGEALYAACSGVVESLGERIEAEQLQQLVSDFILSFRASTLLGPQALPC